MKLITRYCKCGCGKFWRCLPTSTNEYALSAHDPRPKYHVVRFADYWRVKRWLKALYGDEKQSEEKEES